MGEGTAVLSSLEERSAADIAAVPALRLEADALSSAEKEGLGTEGSQSGEV